MRYLINYQIFESKKNSEKSTVSKILEKEVQKFKRKWNIELDSKFTESEIKTISEALSYFKVKFLKNKIQRIIREDLGAVHGKWKETEKKRWMILNPRVFSFKRRWKDDDTDLPYAIFTIVHEVAHCIDHIERVSFSKEWQSISGWKKCDRDEKVPEGYTRYIEKRPGRAKPGSKKSTWIHKKDAEFCRKYTSKNPREDFADCLAFVILGLQDKLKGKQVEKKLEIVNRILKKVD